MNSSIGLGLNVSKLLQKKPVQPENQHISSKPSLQISKALQQDTVSFEGKLSPLDGHSSGGDKSKLIQKGLIGAAAIAMLAGGGAFVANKTGLIGGEAPPPPRVENVETPPAQVANPTAVDPTAVAPTQTVQTPQAPLAAQPIGNLPYEANADFDTRSKALYTAIQSNDIATANAIVQERIQILEHITTPRGGPETDPRPLFTASQQITGSDPKVTLSLIFEMTKGFNGEGLAGMYDQETTNFINSRFRRDIQSGQIQLNDQQRQMFGIGPDNTLNPTNPKQLILMTSFYQKMLDNAQEFPHLNPQFGEEANLAPFRKIAAMSYLPDKNAQGEAVSAFGPVRALCYINGVSFEDMAENNTRIPFLTEQEQAALYQRVGGDRDHYNYNWGGQAGQDPLGFPPAQTPLGEQIAERVYNVIFTSQQIPDSFWQHPGRPIEALPPSATYLFTEQAQAEAAQDTAVQQQVQQPGNQPDATQAVPNPAAVPTPVDPNAATAVPNPAAATPTAPLPTTQQPQAPNVPPLVQPQQ